MIKIENFEIAGWEAAIRTLRGANGLKESDSEFDVKTYWDDDASFEAERIPCVLGENDHELMVQACKDGVGRHSFMRIITVCCNIVAPLYWWDKFDACGVCKVANSCSTMHKIAEKEFTLDDFSHEHLISQGAEILNDLIGNLNSVRDAYLHFDDYKCKDVLDEELACKKDVWWQMIQLLPSSYNQCRAVTLDYGTLANIYQSYKNHELDEYRDFCKWIESLPYSELITEST